MKNCSKSGSMRLFTWFHQGRAWFYDGRIHIILLVEFAEYVQQPVGVVKIGPFGFLTVFEVYFDLDGRRWDLVAYDGLHHGCVPVR